MRCPYCSFADQKVLDSRPGTDGESIRRRRECERCKRRFTTFERFERARFFAIKRDGSREDFQRDKVFESIRLACRKRPVPTDTIRSAVDRIEQVLSAEFEDEVSTREIGSRVMRELSAIDQVAYVRFASVYQEFESVSDFEVLVERVQQEEALKPFLQLQESLL